MRIIRNKDVVGTVESRVPPGAYVAKFYRDGDLDYSWSGVDTHPLGATLIRVSAHVDWPSDVDDVIIRLWKNWEELAEVTILANESDGYVDLAALDLVAAFDFLTSAPDLYFRPLLDKLQVEIWQPGNASSLTVSCTFDR